MEACGSKSFTTLDFLGVPPPTESIIPYIIGFLALGGLLFSAVSFMRKRRAEQRRLRLQGDEVSQVVRADYGSITYPARRSGGGVHGDGPTVSDPLCEQTFAGAEYYPEHPRWIL